MKRYLIEITTMMDDTTAQAIWPKDDAISAEMQYHQTLASAMANENVKMCLVMIINEIGAVERHEVWDRPITTPEPEITEETQEEG